MSDTETQPLHQVQSALSSFSTAMQGTLSWGWDGRFACPVAQFPTDQLAAICAALETSLGSCWRSSDMAGAPPQIQQIGQSLGGVRGGQRLYTTDAGSRPIAIAALWPWDNGTVVSIRIFIDGDEPEDVFVAALERSFGVQSSD